MCTRAKLDELDAIIGAAYNADNCPLREERHKGAKIFYTFKGGARLPIEVEVVHDPHTNAGHTSLDLLHWAFAAKNRKDPEWKEREIFPGFTAICCPLRVLMAIKRSHLIFKLQWQKHIRDYHLMRAKSQELDDAIPPADALDAFINRRRREIKIRLGDKSKDRIHLDVPNEEFFKVHYLKAMTSQRLLETRLNEGASIYEHDELHALLAVGSHPVYTSMKHDPSKAMLEKELFDAADHTTKLNLVREEAMAIAAERIVVPALLKLPASTPAVEAIDAVDDAEAYSLGLQMTLTHLSKGWFRTFGLDHWPEVSECPFAGMGTGMTQKIVEDSRIIFDGKPFSWSPCDKNNCYSLAHDLQGQILVETQRKGISIMPTFRNCKRHLATSRLYRLTMLGTLSCMIRFLTLTMKYQNLCCYTPAAKTGYNLVLVKILKIGKPADAPWMVRCKGYRVL